MIEDRIMGTEGSVGVMECGSDGIRDCRLPTCGCGAGAVHCRRIARRPTYAGTVAAGRLGDSGYLNAGPSPAPFSMILSPMILSACLHEFALNDSAISYVFLP